MRRETVTILRPGPPTGTDAYNQPIPGPDVRIDVDGCLVAPRLEGDATEGGRQGVIIGTTVYFPKDGEHPTSTDRLEVRGKPHIIEGEPGPWPGSPTGWDTEVATRRVEG